MSIIEFISLGGTIAYILLALNILGFSIIFWKSWVIYKFNKKNAQQLTESIMNKVNSHCVDRHIIVDAVRTETDIAFSPLLKGLTTVENIATIAPMLGLLGTVIGIFNSFSVIASQGLDDPALFASGIKYALVTTVIGLIVAIPHIIGFNYLNFSIERSQEKVENEVMFHLNSCMLNSDHN